MPCVAAVLALAAFSQDPPASPAQADSLLRQADAHAERRETREALALYGQAAGSARTLPDDSSAVLLQRALLGQGVALTAQNRLPQAELALNEALSLGEASAAGRDVLRALASLAYLHNQIAKAEAFLVRGAPPASAEPIELARHCAAVAGLALERGQYQEAAAGLRQSLAIYEAHRGGSSTQLVPILRNLSRCLRFQGDYVNSIDAVERALAIASAAFGSAHAVSLQLMGTLAAAKAESGEFPAARDLYERALRLQEAALGSSHPQVGADLFSLANLQQVMGDFDTAIRHAERALVIRESADGPQSARTAPIYALLGRVEALRGNLPRARDLAFRAVEIGRRTSGPNHPRTIYAVSDLGEVLYLSGQAQAARDCFEQAWNGQTKLFGDGNVRTAQSAYNLGLAELRLRRHREALAWFDRAVSTWQAHFGPDYPLLSDALAGKAASLAALGRSAEALTPALESARVRRVAITPVAWAGAEREALLFARVDRDGLSLAVEFAPAAGADAVRRIWDAVILDRALVFDTIARRRRLSGLGGEVAALSDAIDRHKKDLAQAALLSDGRAYLKRVTALREQVDRAERALASRLPGPPAQASIGYGSMVRALPAGSALVSYVNTGSRYVAFAARPGSAAPVAVSVGESALIEGLVRAWRCEILTEKDSLGRNARRNEADYRAAGVALRKAIWDPLSAHLAGVRTVLLSPGGALQLLNFDTLPVGSNSYFIDRGPRFVVLSAERDLLSSPPAAAPARGVLALGDPASSVPRLDACGAPGAPPWPRLPSAAIEARTVAKLWSARGEPADLRVGPGATEAYLRRFAAGRRALHVAAHGFFLSSQCRLPNETVLAANPFLRSGLVLAPGPDGNDGLLTAEEVSALPLSGVELVTLSGCDTALGEIQAGEGVLGLRRAFRAAGVRFLVTGLWAVEDAMALEWMTAFYRAYLAAPGDPSAAARQASAAHVIQRRRAGLSTHPFYWGAFLCSGS